MIIGRSERESKSVRVGVRVAICIELNVFVCELPTKRNFVTKEK